MSEQVLKTEIPREKEFIYFVKGNPLEIHKAPMSRSGKKAKKK